MHVYHPARLKVLAPQKTVSGIVKKVKPEPDGDYHIYLQNIELEIICASKITQADARGPCSGYKNKIPIPKVGWRVKVTGQYIFDKVHKQKEIHPVFNLTRL